MAVRGFFVALIVCFIFAGYYPGVLSYSRPLPRKTFTIHPSDEDDDSPQQVHISLVGSDKMRISWITEDFGTPAIVRYGTSSGNYTWNAEGTTNSYKFTIIYKSGEIHYVDIGPLKPNTVYYYSCGVDGSREFTLKTPPAQFPIKFAVIGDLAQTEWTKSNLNHVAGSNYDVLLLPGDLSYANFYQPWWDSFGRLVEPLASQRPWMVTQGNHEIEKVPVIHSKPFTAYNARWYMPHEQSGSDSNLYYSFEVAGVHVVVLGSYADFEVGTPQYKWLQADLAKVDRRRTPWLVAMIHAPWYNSNTDHQGEYQCDGMKKAMESLLYGAHVDIVFAGHVHVYERFNRVYQDKENACGPVHITIGCGGRELAEEFSSPQPKISLFREASYGHGEFQVMNGSHALWTWHRNAGGEEAVIADSIWLTSFSSNPACKKV